MNLKRAGILLRKELLQGPRNFIFVWAVIAPVAISLVSILIFSAFSSEKPELGIYDEGSSSLTTMAGDLTEIRVKEYDSVEALKQDVERGALDVGIVLPENFDEVLGLGEQAGITAYRSGESLAKDRSVVMASVAGLIRELAGQERPVDIESVALETEAAMPWKDRLLPLIVLMAVFLGGLFLPATSIIIEKERKTLEAVLVTPASVRDVFLAKGTAGVLLSLFVGIIILALNRAFGAEPLLLIAVLGLGAVMAALLGLLCGALIGNVTSLFAIWKLGGILLFAPAFVYIFPQIPEWVARIFPTYYLIQPIAEVGQGGSWPEVMTSILVLLGLNALLAALVLVSLRRTSFAAA